MATLSHNDTFLIKEYESLRNEMNESIRETRNIERNVLIATALIWSWLALKLTEYPQYEVLIWLPFPLVLLSGLRAFGLTLHIDKLAKYLAKIENHLITNEKLGFERNFYSSRTIKRISAYCFWLLLLGLTIMIPLYFQSK